MGTVQCVSSLAYGTSMSNTSALLAAAVNTEEMATVVDSRRNSNGHQMCCAGFAIFLKRLGVTVEKGVALGNGIMSLEASMLSVMMLRCAEASESCVEKAVLQCHLM